MQGYDNSPEQPSEMLWASDRVPPFARPSPASIRSAIRGISLSGQMHGTVMYDARGECIEPIINWQDKRCDIPLERYGNRTTVEVMMAELLAGPEFDDLGIDVLPSGYLGATLFYIKENDPALFERIRTSFCPAISSGASCWAPPWLARTDPTNAFGTGLFNTRLVRWHDSIIAEAWAARAKSCRRSTTAPKWPERSLPPLRRR